MLQEEDKKAAEKENKNYFITKRSYITPGIP